MIPQAPCKAIVLAVGQGEHNADDYGKVGLNAEVDVATGWQGLDLGLVIESLEKEANAVDFNAPSCRKPDAKA